MKRISIFLLLSVFSHLLVAVTAFADPRMETNKNFCHFILDPLNTDNEIFAAGCDSVITVVEEVTAAVNALGQCEEGNYVASGHAMVKKVVPPEAAPLASGSALLLTSDMSDTPCTMVESNGRAYQSKAWQSTITVEPYKKGLLEVRYELFCKEGRR